MNDGELLAQALEPLGVTAQHAPDRMSLMLPDGQGFDIRVGQDLDDLDEEPVGRPYLVVERGVKP